VAGRCVRFVGVTLGVVQTGGFEGEDEFHAEVCLVDVAEAKVGDWGGDGGEVCC
jgi:hypothetical protein